MPKLFIRHAETEARGHLLNGTDPSLSETGFRQAESLGVHLKAEGMSLNGVAVSEALRTYDTAKTMGAKRIVTYPLLNEVSHPGMSKQEVQGLAGAGWLPVAALDAAREILENPPAEDVIVTHGLVIAGLTAVLRLNQGLPLGSYPLCPELCGTRQLDI